MRKQQTERISDKLCQVEYSLCIPKGNAGTAKNGRPEKMGGSVFEVIFLQQ